MMKTAEEREMWTAKFVAEASENWTTDVERFKAIAEKMGITWQEALTLQMASCEKTTKERFPERWRNPSE